MSEVDSTEEKKVEIKEESPPSTAADESQKEAAESTSPEKTEEEPVKEESVEKAQEEPSDPKPEDKVNGETEEDGYHTPNDENENDDGEGAPDDDEVEENPAYIPRKGKYYMHDSRDEVPIEEELKKSRSDGEWKHDRFDERWQKPKSKKQLQNRYGFDIRVGETAEEAEANEKTKVVKRLEEKDDDVEEVGKRRVRPSRPGRQGEPREQQARRSEEEAPARVQAEKGPVAGDRPVRNVRPVRNDNAPRTAALVRNVRGGRGRMRTNVTNERPHYESNRPSHNMRQQDDEYRNEAPRRENGRYPTQDRAPPRVFEQDSRDIGREDDRDRPQYENHRRGVMRGAIRGPSYPPRQFSSKTYTNNARGGVRRPVRDNGYHNEGDNAGHYVERSERGHSSSGPSRGGMSRGSWRGAPAPSSGPKRYSTQRDAAMHGGGGGGGVPMQMVPPPQSVVAPAPNTQFVPRHRDVPRQPTDVVYFDPAQQMNRAPPPPREKKIIAIVPPQ